MSLSENGNLVMPVGPMYGNGANDMFGGNNNWSEGLGHRLGLSDIF